jgi:hypothetical protein
MLEDSAEDVEDVSDEPYYDELDREALGAAALEVLENLRREDDDPTRNGDGATNAGNGIDIQVERLGGRSHG